MSERDAYVKKLEAKLEEWDAEIDKLQAKMKGSQADALRNYEEHLKELRAMRKDTLEKMEEVRGASEGAWQDMKAGVEQAWTGLQDAFSKALRRFD